MTLTLKEMRAMGIDALIARIEVTEPFCVGWRRLYDIEKVKVDKLQFELDLANSINNAETCTRKCYFRRPYEADPQT